MFGDKITQSVSEAVKKVLATEKLHPNQQKLDVHEPEKDKLTKKDFEMLRSNKKPKNEAFNPLKHIVNPSPAVRAAAKDVKRGSYADRAALMKAGGVKDDRGPRGVTQEEVESIDETVRTPGHIKKHLEDLYGSSQTTMTGTNFTQHIIRHVNDAGEDAHEVRTHELIGKGKDSKVGKLIKHIKPSKKFFGEEIEQIDELSTKTLAKAAGAASDPDSDYSYGKSHDPQKFADHAKKTKDAKSAAAVQGAADAKGHYPRDNRTQGYDKLANRTPARVTAAGKANRQDVNKLKGNIKRNEEVEEAVESPFTSYKKPREIESRGGSGIKLGSRYGGGKQKDEPTQDEAPKTKKPKGKMVEQTFTGQGSSPDLNMASDIAKMKAKNDAMRHVYGDNFKDKKMVPHTVGKMDMTQDGKNYVVKSPLTLNNPPDKEKDRLGESNRLMNFKEMFGE